MADDVVDARVLGRNPLEGIEYARSNSRQGDRAPCRASFSQAKARAMSDNWIWLSRQHPGQPSAICDRLRWKMKAWLTRRIRARSRGAEGELRRAGRPLGLTRGEEANGQGRGIRADWRHRRCGQMPEDLLVCQRPSGAREMVDQICASSNPLISWMRQIEALRSVA